MRILISAAACGPDSGPEASAGWAFAAAAAQNHDVWLITRPRLRAQIEQALAADPHLQRHVTMVYHDLSERVQRLRKRPADLYWYYSAWQFTLATKAKALHRSVGFDVAHHVTFANDWLPCGLAWVDEVPLVWGPVGGASDVPIWRMRRWLGLRGWATEVARRVLTGLPRRIFGDHAANRAAVVVAQNPDVARRFRQARFVVIEPNASLDLPPKRSVSHPVPRRPHHAVFVGRLLAWKGARLAIATLGHPSAAHWTLDVYGEGYELPALRELADSLGVNNRVTFMGHRPRAEVLEAFTTCSALLFPSMHDQAGWVAAEASSMGCPVVCLPLGGPPTLAEPNAFVVSLKGDILKNLADALNEAAASTSVIHQRWAPERLPSAIGEWYLAAAGPSSAGS